MCLEVFPKTVSDGADVTFCGRVFHSPPGRSDRKKQFQNFKLQSEQMHIGCKQFVTTATTIDFVNFTNRPCIYSVTFR